MALLSSIKAELSSIYTYIVLFWFALNANLLNAQSEREFYVEKKFYTYLDGLPGRSVRYTIQDSLGYMWFVTNNGLCRFDGKNFKTFTKQSHGLYSNNILAIYSDKEGGLIIRYSTETSKYNDHVTHLDVIDIQTLRVSTFEKYYNGAPFETNELREILLDNVNSKSIFYLKPFTIHTPEGFRNTKNWTLENKNFVKVGQKISKTIHFSRINGRITAEIMDYNSNSSLKNCSVLILNNGSAVGFYYRNSFVCYRDKKGGHLLRYIDHVSTSYFYLSKDHKITSVDPKNTHFPSFFFDESIDYLANGQDHLGLIYRKNKSLTLYNQDQKTIALIDSTDSELIRKAIVLNTFRDKIGNYWISTSEGVLKVTIKKKKFHQLFTQNQIPFGLNNSTRGFYRNKYGLWIASYDFVGRWNNNKAQIIKKKYNFSFLETDNRFWIGSSFLETYDYLLNVSKRKQNSEFEEFWTLFPLKTDFMLVGCSDNVGVYQISNNELKPVNANHFKKPVLTYKIFRYQEKIIGVASNGIYFYNEQGKIIDCYSSSEKDEKKRIAIEEINDLHIDKNGIYWICSAVGGLYRWDKKEDVLENFGLEHGFLSTNHYRIEEDDYQNLWISTEFGLAKFNKRTRLAKVFTETDGISNNEFNRISSFNDSDGTLFFGGMNGVTYFHPKDFFEEEKNNDFPFVLNGIYVYSARFNDLEDYLPEYKTIGKIEFNEEIKNASIDFKLLDLEDRIHAYAYQISGLDSTWNYINEGNIKLNNLPYGRYTIKIKAQCSNGMWNKTVLIIPIHVIVPIYKTWWFISISLVTFVLTVFWLVKKRTKYLQNQNEKLELVVGLRTAELKDSLAQQTTLLQEVHHRVKNNLQFIAAMLKMQLNTIKGEKDQKVLLETSRRINAMSLVHEMLYSKEKLEFVSLEDYLNELIEKLQEMVYEMDTPICFDVKIDAVKFNINNCVAIGMISSEIISNAIKYAFKDTRKPEIRIRLEFLEQKKEILFYIADNGEGMRAEKTSTGLGLRLIDIFARQLEAEYETSNENGLNYRFKIPYDKNEQ